MLLITKKTILMNIYYECSKFFIEVNNWFDGVVGYHVSLTPVSSLKVSSSSLGRIIFHFCPRNI